MEPELVYTVDEAARKLRLNRNSAYQAVRRGEIPSVKIGRRLLVPARALDAMLAAAWSPKPEAGQAGVRGVPRAA